MNEMINDAMAALAVATIIINAAGVALLIVVETVRSVRRHRYHK